MCGRSALAVPVHLALPSGFIDCCVGRGLGVPLSLGKLRLGTKLSWLGLTLESKVPAWLLPPSKMMRILTLLDDVILVLPKPSRLELDRETLEQGTGLLLWVAECRRELRPWLAVFYHTLAQQHSTLVSVSPEFWARILTKLDANLVVQDSTPGPDAPLNNGWKVLAMGTREFRSLE